MARISSKAHGCIGPSAGERQESRTPEPYDMGTGQKQWQQHKNKGFGEVRVKIQGHVIKRLRCLFSM